MDARSDSVGQNLDLMIEGQRESGEILVIRGAGGLIAPSKYPRGCISFRHDEASLEMLQPGSGVVARRSPAHLRHSHYARE